MDGIKLTGLKVFAHHGVLKEEKEKGQDFYLDIVLSMDLHRAGRSDGLDKTVNYAEMAGFATEAFTSSCCDLIEAAGMKVVDALLLKYESIKEISVTVHKPSAPINADFEDVSVTLSGGRHKAYISVGSNVGDSLKTIEEAKQLLNADPKAKIVREASLITTKPYGGVEQPDFINGMWIVETTYEPFELLEFLNRIEAEEKRERLIHWGPRTLDLDIIYFDDLVMHTDRLTIPHGDMENREFVLKPLEEIDAYMRNPVNGLTAKQMLAKLN